MPILVVVPGQEPTGRRKPIRKDSQTRAPQPKVLSGHRVGGRMPKPPQTHSPLGQGPSRHCSPWCAIGQQQGAARPGAERRWRPLCRRPECSALPRRIPPTGTKHDATRSSHHTRGKTQPADRKAPAGKSSPKQCGPTWTTPNDHRVWTREDMNGTELSFAIAVYKYQLQRSVIN